MKFGRLVQYGSVTGDLKWQFRANCHILSFNRLTMGIIYGGKYEVYAQAHFWIEGKLLHLITISTNLVNSFCHYHKKTSSLDARFNG